MDPGGLHQKNEVVLCQNTIHFEVSCHGNIHISRLLRYA